MRLSGKQRQNLQLALIDAFRDKVSLEQMLSHELDKNLDEIASGSNLQNIAFNLIKVADAEGWIEDLIRAALESNPKNSKLGIITEELLKIKLDNDSIEPETNIHIEQSSIKERCYQLQHNGNPFQTVGPLPHNISSYIKRECDSQLVETLQSRKLIEIVGEFQIGKSSLLNQVIKAPFLANLDWKDCYINLEEMSTHNTQDFMEEFIEAISISMGNVVKSWKDLFNCLKSQYLILRIDEFGWLTSEIASHLIPKFYTLSLGENIRIIICLPVEINVFLKNLKEHRLNNPKYLDNWSTIKIEPFNKKEIIQMLNLLPEFHSKIALSYCDTIMSLSSCRPIKLQRLCNNLFEISQNRQNNVLELKKIIENPDSYKR